MKSKYSDQYRKLGLNIAYYRKDRLMSQEELGSKLNIDQSHMSKIECSAVGISLDMLFAICDALEVPPHKLLEFRD